MGRGTLPKVQDESEDPPRGPRRVVRSFGRSVNESRSPPGGSGTGRGTLSRVWDGWGGP